METIKKEISEFFKSINLFLLILGIVLELVGFLFKMGESVFEWGSFNLKTTGNLIQYTGLGLVILSVAPYLLKLYAKYKKIKGGA